MSVVLDDRGERVFVCLNCGEIVLRTKKDGWPEFSFSEVTFHNKLKTCRMADWCLYPSRYFKKRRTRKLDLGPNIDVSYAEFDKVDRLLHGKGRTLNGRPDMRGSVERIKQRLNQPKALRGR